MPFSFRTLLLGSTVVVRPAVAARAARMLRSLPPGGVRFVLPREHGRGRVAVDVAPDPEYPDAERTPNGGTRP